jgi:hypothetical protein
LTAAASATAADLLEETAPMCHNSAHGMQSSSNKECPDTRKLLMLLLLPYARKSLKNSLLLCATPRNTCCRGNEQPHLGV